jgi:short-subunit dehydrogenase
MSFQHRYGPWAIVTGASSGIGEALARELAGHGLCVVLVARRRDRLEALAAELGVPTQIVALDLAADGAVEDLAAAVADKDVGLVCANAGFGEKGAFESIDLATYRRMIRLNCEATLGLVHALVPRLVARGRGGIVIVASTAAFQGAPWTSAYAATKAFDLVLAEGLHVELAPRGVDVVALCPGPTDTEGPRRTGVDPARVPFGFASAALVARSGLDGLGTRSVVVPRRLDRLLVLATRLLPRRWSARAAGRAIRNVVAR